MNSNRKQYIVSFAEKLRASLNLSSPVDLETLVETLGGCIEPFKDQFGKDAEAYVRKTGQSFAIATKGTRGSAQRERFSIAHEIGHLFIHLGYKIDPELWDSITEGYVDSVRHRLGYNEEEYEANEFAAALLMPELEFISVSKEFLSDGQFDLDSIARHFGVSRQAVKTRGQWLGLFSWG